MLARSAAKRLVGRTIGELPYFEYRLRIRRLPETLKVRAWENLEVRRAVALLGPLRHTRVATVIPTYRRPVDLMIAVESALAQTVTDHTVIVVDDGAGLPALPQNRRLVAISLTRNLGVVGAVRNVGIRVSSSDFVAFLDDDNWWEEDHLERSLDAQRDGSPRMTYSGLHRVDSSGKTVDVLAEPFDRRRLKERGFVDASTIVLPRTRQARFSRTPRRFGDFPREDWEMAWRLSRHMVVEHVPAVTVCYVVHDRSHFTNWAAEHRDVDDAP